jgi:hypothetical protein
MKSDRPIPMHRIIGAHFLQGLQETLSCCELINTLSEDKSPDGRVLLEEYAAVLRFEAEQWRRANFKRTDVGGPIQ